MEGLAYSRWLHGLGFDLEPGVPKLCEVVYGRREAVTAGGQLLLLTRVHIQDPDKKEYGQYVWHC